MRRDSRRRLRALAWLAGGLAACSPTGEVGDERWARRGASFGYAPWQAESTVPAEPQQAPAMVIWEVTRFAPDSEPSESQRTAAQDLIERSYASARERGWTRFGQAKRDGYRLLFSDTVHFVNEEYVVDDAILDPERPEFLMYYKTDKGRALVGYMFLARTPTEWGPQVGGPLTLWHYHVWSEPGCMVGGLFAVSKPDAQGRCARGWPSSRTPEMIHVWLVDHPEGPFSTKMRIDPKLVPGLLAKRMETRGF